MASSKIKGITIQLGADTTGLDKAIKGIETETKKAAKELTEVNKTMKSSGDSAVLWEQKQKLLSTALEESKKKLKLLEEAQEQVNKQFQDKNIGEEQYRAFQRETESARAAVEKYRTGLREASDKLNELSGETDTAASDMKGFGDASETAASDVKNLGDESAATGKDIEEAGESAEAASGGYSVLKNVVADLAVEAFKELASAAKEAYLEIDEGYDTIIKKTGASGESLEELEEIADRVYSSLPVEMSDVGTAVGELNTRFGSTGDELEELSSIFLQYASINETDVNSSIDNVSAAMKAFGVDTSEASDILGVLTSVSQKTGIETSQLESLLVSNSATFKEMNLDIAEAAELLGQFEINGVDTSTAVTALKKTVVSATADGKTANEALAETIESIKSAADETEALQIASETFGTKGAAAMTQAIRENRFTVDDLSASYEDMGNIVTETFEGTAGAPEELKKTTNSLKLELSGMLEKVLPYVEKYVSEFNSKLPELKAKAEKFEPVFEGISKVLGTALDIAEDLFDWMGNVIDANFGYQDHLNEIFDKGTEKARSFADGLSEAKDRMEELTDASNEEISTGQAQINKTQELWEELQSLVDQNGNVKQGYEDRVSYISNELSEATDAEIEIIDGQIQKYDELKNIIDETIQKQRAQVFQNALSEKYSEALSGQSTYAQDYIETEDRISENQAKIDQMEQEFRDYAAENNVYIDPNTKFSSGNYNSTWSKVMNEGQLEQLRALEQSIAIDEQSLRDLDNSVDYYNEVISLYEQANEEYQSGKYDLAESTYAQINKLNKDELHSLEEDQSDTLDTVKSDLKSALRVYNVEVSKGIGTAGTNLKTAVDSAVDYGLSQGLSGADLLKTGIIDALSSIDSFDASDLESFMEETGLTLGDILSETAYENLSGSLLSAVTRVLYETDDLIKDVYNDDGTLRFGAVNSPGDVSAYVKQYAEGGFITSGSRGIVAEAGPELLEVMQGGVKVTPLTSTARNTPVSTGSQKLFYNNYTINAVIRNGYDVKGLAEVLATEQRRIEEGKGI